MLCFCCFFFFRGPFQCKLSRSRFIGNYIIIWSNTKKSDTGSQIQLWQNMQFYLEQPWIIMADAPPDLGQIIPHSSGLLCGACCVSRTFPWFFFHVLLKKEKVGWWREWECTLRLPRVQGATSTREGVESDNVEAYMPHGTRWTEGLKQGRGQIMVKKRGLMETDVN